MSKKCIAIIYEGEKTERILIQNLQNHFFEDTELISVAFPAGENLYMLWKQLKADDFETDAGLKLRKFQNINIPYLR